MTIESGAMEVIGDYSACPQLAVEGKSPEVLLVLSHEY